MVVSLAMRRGFYGRNITYLGFTTGIFDIIGAYPDTIGPISDTCFPIIVNSMILSGGLEDLWITEVGYK